MLDAIHPWGARLRPYLSSHVHAQVVNEPWQLDAYRRLRSEIFCQEQSLFEGSDFDAWDESALPIVALSQLLGMPDEVVGVVRIYEAEAGVWYGGRLGVCSGYRRRGAVGGALIECAVSTAHALGCRRFLATIQLQNVRYFEHYAFRCLGPVSVHGRPHQLMEAALEQYPGRSLPAGSFDPRRHHGQTPVGAAA
jgi:putative N-acetyltransferase (TIGR04045 family)